MKIQPQKLTALFIALLFIGCGKSNEPGIGQGIVAAPQSCDLRSQQQFIVEVMNDTYFWYDEVETINLDDYDSVEQTLDALKVPQDRFSYITTQEANDNFFEEGTFEGFGFRSLISESRDSYIIGYTFTDSPSGQAGWQRTDQITAINGVTAAEIISADGLNSVLSGLNIGDTATFTLLKNNTETDYELIKAIVTMNTVLTSQVIQTENNIIGYVGLSNFIENTTDDFSDAIDALSEANISELVLDLRYNGGGRVSASRDVASLIGGNNTSGFNFSKTIHNDKYANSNSNIPYSSFSNALDLTRVYIITTAATCSASELIINSLSPFVEVITIGETTCGKPVGMYGKRFCEQIILPIEFQSLNHNNEGDYFDGIFATCSETDDLSHSFGDTQESMFAEAIYHMENGSCSLPPGLTAKQHKPHSETKFWIPSSQNH